MGRIYLTIIAALIGAILALGIHIKGLWFIDGLEDRIAPPEPTAASIARPHWPGLVEEYPEPDDAPDDGDPLPLDQMFGGER